MPATAGGRTAVLVIASPSTRGRQPHRQPPGTPCPWRAVEHAGARCAARAAPTRIVEAVRTELVPVPLDDHGVARGAAGARPCAVVDVAGVGVVHAVGQGDGPGPGEGG